MADGHGRGVEWQVGRRELVGARWAGLVVCLVLFAAALLGSVPAQAAAAGGLGFSWAPSKTEPYAVCGRPTASHSECQAILVPSAPGLSSSSALPHAAPGEVSPTATPTLQGTGVGGGFAPADLRSAYDLPSETDGSGQTVAIVDAYDDPDAEKDLERYRSHYGIAACTTADGCFRKVNQKGETAPLPKAEAGWAVEISLDLDMVSTACPKCHILLVEATNNSDENLYVAEDEAVKLGASEISNSWAGEEYSGETADDTYFDHPGVPIFASAGDEGYGVNYPAASRYVVAVGGTTLKKASNSRGWSETVWEGTGSGCSKYESEPAWQTASPDCKQRTNNDIASVASPATPVSIADSYKLPREFSQPEAGWTLVGGTSVSSPLMAGTMALASAYTKSFGGADAYYEEAVQNGTGVLNDVTSGSDGSCGGYLCKGEVGYDGPTGLGSPYGAPVVSQEAAPTVETQAASSLTQTAVTLNGTVNPGGEEVTKCEFEYGTSPTLAGAAKASCSSLPGSGESPVAVSAPVVSLAPSTVYYFRADATSAGGTGKGGIETLTTLPTLSDPPEFGRCKAVGDGNGKYSSGGCTSVGGKDDYEWIPGVADTAFKTKLTSGSVTLESAVKTSKVTCTGETGDGEYSGLKTVSGITLTLTGCERSTEKCSSTGAATGEIVTKSLEGVLGVEKLGTTSASDKIGLDLFPVGAAGPVMEFSCGVTAVVVQGSVIVPVKADKMLFTAKLKVSASNGRQKPESFVGDSSDVLEESFDKAPFEQVGLRLSTTQTNEEGVEVNSVV
jgi:hypothetical protein